MKRYTEISILHYAKLVWRLLLLLTMAVIYIRGRVLGNDDPFGLLGGIKVIHYVFFGLFALSAILRFFPSHLESMGCEKIYKRNYIPTVESTRGRHRLGTLPSTLAVLLAWLALNGAIAALYYTGIIDEGILVLVAIFYSVSDMVCILFFCPFQTWIMKNKCCGTCRIYNWDYVMMFTPLIFVPHPLMHALFTLGLALFILWELAVLIHPERFDVTTNAALRCVNCPEKLCHHKRQLRSFLRRNGNRFRVKENFALLTETLTKTTEKLAKKAEELTKKKDEK